MNVEALGASLADRYRLERQLGQACPERTRGGGMATVSLAHDVKHDRQVGLKVLRPEPGSAAREAVYAENWFEELKAKVKP